MKCQLAANQNRQSDIKHHFTLILDFYILYSCCDTLKSQDIKYYYNGVQQSHCSVS